MHPPLRAPLLAGGDRVRAYFLNWLRLAGSRDPSATRPDHEPLRRPGAAPARGTRPGVRPHGRDHGAGHGRAPPSVGGHHGHRRHLAGH
ncbi:hypothetical protein ACFQX7_26175 [Luedemannella flava]